MLIQNLQLFTKSCQQYYNFIQTHCGYLKNHVILISKEMEIFIHPAPTNDEYEIDVVYYDSEGNKYE